MRTDENKLSKCDFIIICVPTPLDEGKKPDLSFVKSAYELIAKNLRKGQFIILESTTYPGTTEEVVIPIIERSNLRGGKDFGIAYSPERVDPGNKRCRVDNTAKIVGGIKHCIPLDPYYLSYKARKIGIYPRR